MGLTRKDFERLYPKLKAVLRKKGRGLSDEEVDDLVQTTFLVACKSLHKFRGEAQVDTWIVSIAKNLLLKKWREASRAREEVPVDESLEVVGFEDEVVARDVLERASRVIQKMPEEQREVVRLMAQGSKYREIAETLGISENRVAALIHQARKKLHQQLYA